MLAFLNSYLIRTAKGLYVAGFVYTLAAFCHKTIK